MASSQDEAQLFGKVTDLDSARAEQLRTNLLRISTCTALNKPCAPAAAALKTLYGDLYSSGYPDFIIYLHTDPDQTYDPDSNCAPIRPATRSIDVSGPVLFWKEKAAVNLYGAQRVWLLIFSDYDLKNLEAHITTLSAKPPNPVAGLFGLASKVPSAEQKVATDESAETVTKLPIVWSRIYGDSKTCRPLYYAVSSAFVSSDTTSRVSVYTVDKDPEDAQKVSFTVPLGDEEKTVKVEVSNPAPPAKRTLPTLMFRSVHGSFSNSRAAFSM